MIRQKKVQQVVGRDVLTSDGKWQRIIGNNVVYPGCYVWADGNVVYGNLMQRGTMAPAVFPDKYVLPLMTNSVNEKGQTGEYTINLPALEESYDTFFPRTGNTGAFACTSNFYLTTTHDNLLDFCVADTAEKNAPPARLINAIESVPASKNLSADGYLGAYEKISGATLTGIEMHAPLLIRNINGYISFVKFKQEENLELFHYVAGKYVPLPSEINEGVAVDCTVENATEVIDKQEESTQNGKTLVTICGTNTEVDLVKITLNNFGDDFINVINGVNLDSPQITSIDCTVIDARVNGDGKWIMRINARMYANAYYTYSYTHTFLSVYYENTVRVGNTYESRYLHTGECYYTLDFNEKGGFRRTSTFSYVETVDFWLSSDGEITLVQKEIKDYSINRISRIVRGDWFVKEQNGEENPWVVTRDIHLNPGEYKVKDSHNFIKTAMATTIEWEQHYFDAQHYYVYNGTVIDKTINITETNEKPMTIDIGKGNKLTFKSIPENHGSTPKIEIVSIHDAAGNEYADLAGQKISGVGFLDIESWRGKTFFIYRPYSKYQSILKVDGKDDGHNPRLTSRIAVMKKRDLKNGALVDWS